MRFTFLRVFYLYLVGTSWGSKKFPCEVFRDKLFCKRVKLSSDVNIHVDPPIHELLLDNVRGSIGVKTLAPFVQAGKLEIRSFEVFEIEDGALCSLPKLKTLILMGNKLPILTKKQLSGCGNVENFKCDIPLEDDALEEMTGLKTLTLQTLSRSDTRFTKAFLTPLIHLEHLALDLEEWELEPGLFCTQPTLKELCLSSTSPINITKSLFEGCNNLQYIHLSEKQGYTQIPEGQYPFSNMLHLETLYIGQVTNHLTKHFLDGLPNLKLFSFTGNRYKKLDVDKDAFEGAREINRLRFISASLEDSDLEALHVLSKLSRLELERNNIQDLNSIPALSNLEYIDARNNKINKFNFSAFKEKFPSLKLLLMMGNRVDPAFEEELSNENEILIRTSYNGMVNKNKSLWAIADNYLF